MATITKTYTGSKGKLTLKYTGTNQTVSGNFALTSPTIQYGMSGISSSISGSDTIHVSVRVVLTVSIGSQTIGSYTYTGGKTSHWYNDNPYSGSLTLSSVPANTVYLSNVFNTSNSTSLYNYVLITIKSISASVRNEYNNQGASWNYYNDIPYTTAADAIAYIYLNAPPTFSASNITYDRAYLYKSYTKASTVVNSLSAKYGGTIKSCVFQIGNAKSASNVTNGATHTVTLADTGSVTPKVIVTDSRGQTTTKTFAAITVDSYKLPVLASMTAQRLNSSNVAADDGERILITAKFTYDTNITKLQAPVTTYKREIDSSASTPTITWYSNTGLTTTISNWDTISSGATIYGLITSTCSKDYSYLITCTPRDKMPNSGTLKSLVVSPAYYTIDFRAGGKGIAFGGPASTNAFDCNMVAHFRSNRYIYVNDTTSSSGDDLILKNKFAELGWTNSIK